MTKGRGEGAGCSEEKAYIHHLPCLAGTLEGQRLALAGSTSCFLSAGGIWFDFSFVPSSRVWTPRLGAIMFAV